MLMGALKPAVTPLQSTMDKKFSDHTVYEVSF